ncbi:MAG TPA: phosphoribosylformylglycinamidine synthase subunit PurQ [Caldithrix abyssi]|uniref:Phosphoribosylformylglycinamidine synthase subunit PurQ n=1 Tax=Caldithrix abyssi TaxID=187145 RepID=A0A7V4TYI9_CALAY|nr:phosphoribosylformylglycinamidine synthase subunit PurQ [Caldithrix abyssi]
MKTVRSLVITGFGINCEEEMGAACTLAGAQADIVHLNQILHERVSIHEYDLLNFPGGFSFGDDLGSAKVLGNKIKFRQTESGKKLLNELERFLSDGKYIIGVCNGFQALVKMGLLPNIGGRFEQEVTLTYNDSGRFEDRWVKLRVNKNSPTPFLKGLQTFDVPVRHGEGKLLFADEEVRRKVIEKNLNCLSYADSDGNPTAEYPFNPNGSELNCAGLTDPGGQVFGLMPHPEAYLSLYNHPDWARRKRQNPGISEEGEGLKIFRNIVEYIGEKYVE